jgi:hypothetical protein
MLLCATCAHASDRVLELAGAGGYHERLESRTLVSGAAVLGVQSVVANASLDPRRLAVYLAAAPQQQDLLCVQITTSAGHYWSRNAYRLAPSAGWTGLQTDSRHVNVLDAIRDPAFAVRAELRAGKPGDDPDEVCARANRGTPVLVVAGIGQGESPPADLTVMLNSKMTPARVELSGQQGAGRSVGRCERLRDVAIRAYDTRCRIALPPAAAGRHELLVTLTEPGEEPEVHRLQLLLP